MKLDTNLAVNTSLKYTNVNDGLLVQDADNKSISEADVHCVTNRKPSEEEIILRLNRFDYEESKISLYDYVLKNNNLEKTLQIIMTIINQENNLKNQEF